MLFNWYKIFNTLEFEADGFYQTERTAFIEGLGLKTFIIAKGNAGYSVTIDGVMLIANMLDRNPYTRDAETLDTELGMSVYVDESDDVYIGYEAPEE
jgi:hypothetical protein